MEGKQTITRQKLSRCLDLDHDDARPIDGCQQEPTVRSSIPPATTHSTTCRLCTASLDKKS
eukprot:768606-Hanusia_phi.AAC.4